MSEMVLVPCPFCGADPGVSKYDVDDETSKWAAGCNGDGAPESWAYVEHYVSVHASTKAEAITAWNTRASPSSPPVGEGVREKVARIICKAAGFDPDGPTCDLYVEGDPDAGKPWAGYRAAADAIIALLNQTEER